MYQCLVGWHVVVVKREVWLVDVLVVAVGGVGGDWLVGWGVCVGGVVGRGRCCGTSRGRGPIGVVLWWYFCYLGGNGGGGGRQAL